MLKLLALFSFFPSSLIYHYVWCEFELHLDSKFWVILSRLSNCIVVSGDRWTINNANWFLKLDESIKLYLS